MYNSYIPDNLDLFEKRDREQWQWLKRRPKCICCGEHIQDDWASQIEGHYYCDRCLRDARVYFD